ncbi:MAG: hypothetical protein JWQ63_1536 [Mucilaginibacter sp.]|nr:hypothetical protein [Mucilaginibacter sp.]
MKKSKYLIVFITSAVIGMETAGAQDITADAIKAVSYKAIYLKTLTTWDLLSNLYQISLDDITADDKSVKFKSTIFGIHKVFDSTVNNYQRYTELAWQRHLEPYINFSYKNNFDPSNMSFGINYSFVNANDKTESKDMNSNPLLMAKIRALDAKLKPVINTIRLNGKPVDEINKSFDQITKFVRSGDTKDLSAELLKTMTDAGVISDIQDMKKEIDKTALRVANKWNLIFSPQLTYAINRSGVQGSSFIVNGVKGFEILKGRSTQLTIKTGFVLGDDTIVSSINTKRQQITNQLGFNQVLLMKDVKGDGGTANKAPCAELAVSYGFNYLTSGYQASEKRRQPSLSAKFGVLIGKESWLVLPVTYNYATKTTVASISIKVNLGDAPFKSK